MNVKPRMPLLTVIHMLSSENCGAQGNNEEIAD
jgi:hypothetical protein